MPKRAKPLPAAKPLLAFDRRARKAMLPYRDTPAVIAADWVSQAGDQTQLRLLAGGTFALGLVRRDPRMMRAAVRMLIAHEAATLAKDWVKRRVIRARPRSATGQGDDKPAKGHDTRKEKSSFPSGHAAGAMAVAGALAADYPHQAVIAHVAAGSIALGRIPRCQHYPSDVAAGAAIGAASAGTVNLVWRLAARLLARRSGGR